MRLIAVILLVDPYIIQDGINFSSFIDDQSHEFLKDLAYDLRKREWDKVGQDFEVILDDCPQNTNTRGTGPFFCKGYDFYFVKKCLYIYEFLFLEMMYV